MKKAIRIILFTLLFCVLSAVTVGASDALSPALELLAQDYRMTKSGVVYMGAITFDAEDFDAAAGLTQVKRVKVQSLPAETAGRLMLGDLYVTTGQILEREDFSRLKFIPIGEKIPETSFTFLPDGGTFSIVCSLIFTESVNFAPGVSGEAQATWTQENVSRFGRLSAKDPEGDAMTYEILSYPKKGLLSVDRASGEYRYTPYRDATGSDAFTYRAVDAYGNRSASAKVTVSIEKPKSVLTFADMENDKAANEAIRMNEAGLIGCAADGDGNCYFLPDAAVSREEFLKTAMDALGAKNVPTVAASSFADDGDVGETYKGYVECAYRLGIVTGELSRDGLIFRPKDAITRAEASVILNRILGAEGESVAAYADADEVPTWAQSAMNALSSCGIVPPAGGHLLPNEALTRSDAAVMLYNARVAVGLQ